MEQSGQHLTPTVHPWRGSLAHWIG